MDIRTGFFHVGPQIGKLLRGGFSGPARLQYPYPAFRQGGAVRPDLAHEIRIPYERSSFFHGNVAERRAQAEVHTAAVKAQTAVCRQYALDVFG